MKQSNNDKSIQATSQSATMLKIYKAPRLTSYGDVTLLTKAFGSGPGYDGTWSRKKSHSQ